MKLILPLAAYPYLIGMILLFTLYLVVDVWRYRRGAYELTPGQIRRRVAAAVLIEADLLLWLNVNNLMMGRPPQAQLLYMFAGVLLLLAPLFLAYREAVFVMRQEVLRRRDHLQDVTEKMRETASRGE